MRYLHPTAHNPPPHTQKHGNSNDSPPVSILPFTNASKIKVSFGQGEKPKESCILSGFYELSKGEKYLNAESSSISKKHGLGPCFYIFSTYFTKGGFLTIAFTF
jgi:hypothetical protein